MASRAFLNLLANDAGESPRYNVLLRATLTTTTDDVTVKIREIWSGGAVIEGTPLPRIGHDAVLARAGREVFAAVVSCADGQCLLEFEDDMDEGELLMWLHTPGEERKPVVQPRFRRPGLKTQDLKPEEYKEVRSWGYLRGKAAYGD